MMHSQFYFTTLWGESSIGLKFVPCNFLSWKTHHFILFAHHKIWRKYNYGILELEHYTIIFFKDLTGLLWTDMLL